MFQKLRIFAPLAWLEMRMTQIFLLFFVILFFSFVYRHSELQGSCSNGTETRHVISLLLADRSGSRDLTLGCTILNV